MQSGVSFVQFLLTIAAAVIAALGLTIWAVESGPDEGLVKVRRQLGESWRTLSETPWAKIIQCMTRWVVGKSGRLIRSAFQEADQGIGFGGVVFFILFIFFPLAAALNSWIGGSAFLFWYYLSLLAALVFLIVSGETGRMWFVNGVAAVFLGVSLFVVTPVYVVQSFTEVTINSIFSHSVLKSLLVAVIWYVAAYGTGLLIDTWFRSRGIDPSRSPTARFINQFLATLPVAYVLTFMALMAGHLGVLEQNPMRSWQLVLASTGFTALSLPLTLLVQGVGARNKRMLPVWYFFALFGAFDLSALIAIFAYVGTEQAILGSEFRNLLIGLSRDGQGIYLGPQIWILHLRFLPMAVVILAISSGFLVKGVIRGVQAVAGPGAAFDQPFLTTAISCAGIAVFLWAGALLI